MYHATLSLNVERIMREGFKDRSGTAGFLGANLDPPFPPGVWLSTEPALDHPLFDRVTDSSLVMEQEFIEVRVPVPELLDAREHANWTWRAGRQFLMPAALVNSCMRRKLSLDEALDVRLTMMTRKARRRVIKWALTDCARMGPFVSRALRACVRAELHDQPRELPRTGDQEANPATGTPKWHRRPRGWANSGHRTGGDEP
jgi:hypothetical protein